MIKYKFVYQLVIKKMTPLIKKNTSKYSTKIAKLKLKIKL